MSLTNPGDFLTTYHHTNCLNQRKWGDQNKQKNPRIQNITNDTRFVSVIQELKKVVNKSLDFFNASKYFDTY